MTPLPQMPRGNPTVRSAPSARQVSMPHRIDPPAVRKSGDLVIASKYTPIPKLVRRNLYRPERRPDVKSGVLRNAPPVDVPDATPFEITAGVVAVCLQFGIKPGQGGEYDRQRDEYVVIGKTGRWSLPQEYRVPGHLVSASILEFRRKFGEHGGADPQKYLQRIKASGGPLLLPVVR